MSKKTKWFLGGIGTLLLCGLVTYYDTNKVMVGYSEFKRATDHFDFQRIDYWYENGALSYYVVNQLDTTGASYISYFYTPAGVLFDTQKR